MALLKSFSEFLLEKSSSDISEGIFPLKYSSEVTDKEKEISKESFMKIIDILDKDKEIEGMTSSEYEILYQFAKKIGDRKESDIDKELGIEKKEDSKEEYKSYNSGVDSLLETNKKVKSIYEEYIGTKKIKDFKNEENRNKIIEFYSKGLEELRKKDEKFYDSVKSLYGEDTAKLDKSKEGSNIKDSVEKILEIVKPSEEKINYFKTEKLKGTAEGDKAQKEISKESAEDLEKEIEKNGYDSLRGLFTRIIYCISSSYGCLTQINRLTIISSSSDREKKGELMGTFKEDGTIEKEGSVYTNMISLNDKFKEILPEKGEEETVSSLKISSSELDKDKEGSLKNLVFSLRDKIKELQSISDDSVMTQTDWDEYVKDKGREGFRYQDLKESFGYLQGAVNNYCTAENGANAMELYFQTFEDFVKGLKNKEKEVKSEK